MNSEKCDKVGKVETFNFDSLQEITRDTCFSSNQITKIQEEWEIKFKVTLIFHIFKNRDVQLVQEQVLPAKKVFKNSHNLLRGEIFFTFFFLYFTFWTARGAKSWITSICIVELTDSWRFKDISWWCIAQTFRKYTSN